MPVKKEFKKLMKNRNAYQWTAKDLKVLEGRLKDKKADPINMIGKKTKQKPLTFSGATLIDNLFASEKLHGGLRRVIRVNKEVKKDFPGFGNPVEKCFNAKIAKNRLVIKDYDGIILDGEYYWPIIPDGVKIPKGYRFKFNLE